MQVLLLTAVCGETLFRAFMFFRGLNVRLSLRFFFAGTNAAHRRIVMMCLVWSRLVRVAPRWWCRWRRRVAAIAGDR